MKSVPRRKRRALKRWVARGERFPDTLRMLMKFTLPAVVAALLLPQVALSAVKVETVEYQSGDTVCEGVIAYDDADPKARPGILLVHDWMGVSDYAKMRAKQVAELGYVCFVADVYGKGVRPANAGEAAEQAGKYKADRALLRERVNAGLAQLKKNARVFGAKTAAMGYCFGGTAVIELARSGADVAGVVSFHGGLDSPTPEAGKNIKGRVLALHGADDPYVKQEDLTAFQEEMRKNNVDWQMVYYGGAVHSFTNPNAGTDKSKGNAYQAEADVRSWEAMKDFYAQLFLKEAGVSKPAVQ